MDVGELSYSRILYGSSMEMGHGVITVSVILIERPLHSKRVHLQVGKKRREIMIGFY